jgi:hypothetical protein
MSADIDFRRLQWFHPELVANRTIATIEAAKEYYFAGGSNGYIADTDLPPPDFDAELFVLQNSPIADISHLNQAIAAAMVVEGYSLQEVEQNSRYLGFVKQYVRLAEKNTFEFVDPDYVVTPCNLLPGDSICMQKNSLHKFYPTVTSVDSNAAPPRFTVSNIYSDLVDTAATYSWQGTKVCDVSRLGAVNFVRLKSAVDPTQYATDFNYELYQTLYPETRLYSKQECYLDYLGHNARSEYRIAFASDILNLHVPFPTVATNLDVRSNVRVSGYFSLCPGDPEQTSSNYVRVRSIVNDSSRRSTAALSNALITEYAIKKYIDDHLSAAVVDTLTVRSNMYANCPVELNSNVSIAGDAVLNGALVLPAAAAVQSRDAGSIRVDASEVTLCNAGGVSLRLRGADDCFAVLSTQGDASAEGLTDSVAGDLVIAAAPAKRILLGCQGSNSMALLSDRGMRVRGTFGADKMLTLSDKLWKTDIAPLDDVYRRLEGINGYTFVHKDDTTRKQQIGVLAQELLECVPEAVHFDSVTCQYSVAYGNLVAVLAEVAKDMHKRLQRLEQTSS